MKANERLFTISVSPHLTTEEDVKKIMWNTVISLIPPAAFGIYIFGLYSLLLIITSVVFSVLTEAVFLKARNKNWRQCFDGSAVITGILLALTLPPKFPLWGIAIGAAFAISFGKQIFGGIGQNIFNPALVGRAFLMAAFPVESTTWTASKGGDTFTGATPLANWKFNHIMTPYKDLFLGNISGSLGETSVIAILIGGAFLLYKKYIDWRLPLSYVGTVFILGGIFWLINPHKYPDPLFHILAGGLMLGAVYMITDMVTSPITPRGRVIYGIIAGVFVILIRLFAGYPEGVMFSILLVNMIRPWIDRATKPNILGEVKK